MTAAQHPIERTSVPLALPATVESMYIIVTKNRNIRAGDERYLDAQGIESAPFARPKSRRTIIIVLVGDDSLGTPTGWGEPP